MPSKKYEVYVQKGRPWYKIISGILFSHLGLFVLCILYGVIGALIFIEIEHPAEVSRHELKISKTREVVTAVDYLKKIFWQYANNEKYNFSRTDFREQVHGDLTTLKNFVISYVNDYGYDGTDEWDYDWVFSKSLLFTITIMTTIGYGHISPKTFGGKLFCIGYALIGIPLLLVFMKDIGDLMADGVRWMYSRLCCRWCRVRRRDAELAPTADKKAKNIMNDEVGKETYMPTDMVIVPIMVNLIIIFVFLFVGAVIFAAWEGWDIASSIYFCFVTLTTIGFGDMVPENAFLEATKSVYGIFKLAFTVIYCIFGIMLISLALNLMQEQVLEKVRWIASEIGMSGSGNDNEEVVKITKGERLKQTPMDMTGNELDFNEKRLKNADLEKKADELALGIVPEEP